MGFLITVVGYNITDKENEGIRNVYKMKEQNCLNIREKVKIGESQTPFQIFI